MEGKAEDVAPLHGDNQGKREVALVAVGAPIRRQ